jgi:hypothetical protein
VNGSSCREGPQCPAWRAKKNYARLFAKYQEIAEKIGLH